MKIYLNDQLMHEDADSITLCNIKNDFYSKETGLEYIDNRGEYFTVTVNIDDSTKKDYIVKLCRIAHYDFENWIRFKKGLIEKPIKIFLSN